jgi:hypothetical protein
MLMASASCTVRQQPPVSRLKYTSSVGAVEPCTAMMMMPPWSPTCNTAPWVLTLHMHRYCLALELHRKVIDCAAVESCTS